MKFGKVAHPEAIDYTLPETHKETRFLLKSISRKKVFDLRVGGSKWSGPEMQLFYPKGTQDQLAYYSSQLNSIELNATFYRIFPTHIYKQWYSRSAPEFIFFPKMYQGITHRYRLNDKIYPLLHNYLDHVVHLEEKLGTIFVQLQNDFGPKHWDRVVKFIENWPNGIAIAMEFRQTDWFHNLEIAQRLNLLLQRNNIGNVLVDTPGRRDLLHMRLTNDEAFIRFVAANHQCDFTRIDAWIDRLQEWKQLGLKKARFFVHQDVDASHKILISYFIKKANQKWGCSLHVPCLPIE